MSSLSTIASDIAAYDGYQLQAYLLENIDLIGYCAAFYLVMVGKGSTILSWFYSDSMHCVSEKGLARRLLHLYNASFFVHTAMAAVSFGAVGVLAPKLLSAVERRGFYGAACTWDDSLIYAGAAGVAMSILTLSKIAELLTTTLYTLRDYLLNHKAVFSSEAIRAVVVQSHSTIDPPHWWYYSLVSLYFWHTFSIGQSTFPLIASVNGALRGLSNLAMAIEDVSLSNKLAAWGADSHAGGKKPHKRSAVVKAAGLVQTLSMLLECVLCSAIAIYSSYQYYTEKQGCSIMPANVRMCVLMYVSALGLAVYQLRDRQATKQVAVNGGKKHQ